ncbi:MAG: Bug family tripartite tricarboxylate transporter substrate binding protein [Thermodesulfobacteriota bacterium]
MNKMSFMGMVAMVSFLIFSFLSPVEATAQEIYPSKDITLICNSAPGGGFDIFARMVAPNMTKYLKELSPGAKGGDVKVKNMAGASGLQAYEYLFRDAKPDGYTFGDFNPGALYAMLYGSQKIAFDPTEYSWLFSITRTVRVFISNKKGIATWEELIAKSKKGPITFLVPQFGTTAHLDCIYAVEISKIPAKIVATEGTADCLNAVIRGDADAALISYDSVATVCEAKEVNTLVSFTENKVLPWVPTIVEKGFPDCVKYIKRVNRMFMGPPKLDPERERLLTAAGKKLVADPGWLEFCKKRKADVEQPIFGKELKGEIKSSIEDLQKWIPVFKKYGL